MQPDAFIVRNGVKDSERTKSVTFSIWFGVEKQVGSFEIEKKRAGKMSL